MNAPVRPPARWQWRLLGASVQGTSHAKTGAPCQDACGYQALPNGTVLLAVADGAGSAERSEAGALAAVQAALSALEAALAPGWPDGPEAWGAVMADVFAQAQQAVVTLAAAEALPARAFATTLLCAAVSPHGLAVAQVGDGVAVARAQSGEWFLAVAPQRGEYANETLFLTQAEALAGLDCALYPEPAPVVALMTDGLLRLVLDLSRNAPHAPFFEPLVAFAGSVGSSAEGEAQLSAFLASERVCARTDDDKTLVLACALDALG